MPRNKFNQSCARPPNSYMTVLREIKDDLDKYRNMPCSRTGRLQVSSISTLMSQFKEIWIKIPANFFCGHWQTYFKIYKERQKVCTSKTALKQNRVGGLIGEDIKTFRNEQQLKTVCSWYKYRQIDQWSRTENSISDSQIQYHICHWNAVNYWISFNNWCLIN